MGWRENTFDIILRAGIILAVAFFLAGDVMAHTITVFAFVEGKTVTVEGYYGDGRNAGNAKVEVFGPKGEKLLDGVTDREGTYSFTVKAPDDLEIFVTDSAGHQNSFLLNKENFQDHHYEPGEPAHEVSGDMAPGPGRQGREAPLRSNVSYEMLEGVLDRKIQPIIQELGAMRKIMERPSPGDVAGGVGYIVGLAGLIFFLLGKKRRNGR